VTPTRKPIKSHYQKPRPPALNLLHIDINWPQLKALHQIYQIGSTRSKLFANRYLERLRTQKRLLRHRSGNHGIIEATPLFKAFYQENFLEAYQRYLKFFESTGVESDGRRPYRLYDLETLIYIQENRGELRTKLTTERTFAGQLFNSSKYLENNVSLQNAVLKVLGVEQFPKSNPKDHTWRLTVDCPNPVCILLCENLNILKSPDDAIRLEVELWYVGGNNTGILKNLSQGKLALPIHYHCDWDYDGLRIYTNVKRIMEEKNTSIKLLEPSEPIKRLPVNSPYHHSEWKPDKPFSGLQKESFTQSQIQLIASLIQNNQWIEEESQDLAAILTSNGCL